MKMRLAEPVRQTITDEFEKQGQAALLVWYDPGATLASIVGSALPKDAKLLTFEGSYLALRLALEAEDPQFEGRWVVYVPEATPAESWLRDWELLGARWEMDLLELVHIRAGVPITPQLTDLLRNRPQNARELVQSWDSLLGDRSVTEPNLLDALLSLGFGLPGWRLESALLEFVSGAVGRRRLETAGLWALFTERVENWTGWSSVPADETALRQRTEAAVLLSELVTAVPELSHRLREVLTTEATRPLAASVARNWRRSDHLRDSYTLAAERVELEYELKEAMNASEALMDVETFFSIDELWRQEVGSAVAPDGANFEDMVERVAAVAGQRSKLFWARQGQASYWKPVAIAARLYQGCRQATAAAERLSQTDQYVEAYTAEDGWWKLDLSALELAAKTRRLSADERARLVHPAWHAYGAFLHEGNLSFAESVKREGWKPTQTEFWRQFLTGRQRTAILLVDALRYDLARRLTSLLADHEFETTLRTLRSVLPSVTEIGMAAVLPEAEGGLDVFVDEQQLRVRLGGADVASRQGRRDHLQGVLGHQGAIVELDEVDESDLKGVQRLVVLSTEIDEFGTFAADLAPGGLLELVERLAHVLRYLGEQGFERMLVTADHGFLFIPPEVEPIKIERPPAKLCKRRFAIGGTREGCIVMQSEDLGFGGSEVFAFPTGTSVFALPGETGAFLHGGLSLQEALVPVVEARAVAPAEKVAVTMELPRELTSRIAVVPLRVVEPTLFAGSRRVVVEVDGRSSEILELSRDQQEATARISWLGFDDSPPQETTVRLLDADSRQILQEHTIPVELIV